ncbi:MAG TPA: CHAP domain-containing protein [Pseudonocardiaceae bacterium]|nr:CHAP domain-containing protein [Pseudonocardiaceae bacterium]
MSTKVIAGSAVLVAAAAGLFGMAAPAQAATTYHVSGTDGTLAEQSQPQANHVVKWLSEGAAVSVVCQVDDGGQDLGDGPSAPWQQSRTWDQLSDGNWVYDHFITTPAQNSQGWSPGVPQCNTGSVSINADNYPWRVGPDQWVDDGHGYYAGECVSFAAWAIRSDGRSHTKSPDFLGNANMWHGASSTTIPYPGEVAQWDPNVNGAGSAGHVAYVQSVNQDDTITVYEYNWLDGYDGYVGHRLSVRTISAQAPSRYLKF